MSDADSPTLQFALGIVAQHVIARLCDAFELGEQWENYPEIGQYDWERIQNIVGSLTQYPDEDSYRAAYAFLEERADKEWVS